MLANINLPKKGRSPLLSLIIIALLVIEPKTAKGGGRNAVFEEDNPCFQSSTDGKIELGFIPSYFWLVRDKDHSDGIIYEMWLGYRFTRRFQIDCSLGYGKMGIPFHGASIPEVKTTERLSFLPVSLTLKHHTFFENKPRVRWHFSCGVGIYRVKSKEEIRNLAIGEVKYIKTRRDLLIGVQGGGGMEVLLNSYLSIDLGFKYRDVDNKFKTLNGKPLDGFSIGGGLAVRF